MNLNAVTQPSTTHPHASSLGKSEEDVENDIEEIGPEYIDDHHRDNTQIYMAIDPSTVDRRKIGGIISVYLVEKRRRTFYDEPRADDSFESWRARNLHKIVMLKPEFTTHKKLKEEYELRRIK